MTYLVRDLNDNSVLCYMNLSNDGVRVTRGTIPKQLKERLEERIRIIGMPLAASTLFHSNTFFDWGLRVENV